jgi:hypothetical protein
LEVEEEAGTSTVKTIGRIMLTPEPAATSAARTSSRGMLMLLATATAEGVDTPEEELWFTHVSFLLL